MNRFFKKLNQVDGKISPIECLFLYKLAKKTVDEFGLDSTLCEIGSYQGKSTISIAAAL